MNKEKLNELKSALEAVTKINEEIRAKREEFQAEHAVLFEHQAKINEQIGACKEVIIVDAEAGFKADGEKKRLGGIGIRVGVNLLYEADKALKWAIEHTMALSLDKKRFEQLAKTEEIDFVEKEDKVTVTFPKEIKLED